jgi:hypothetical protein
MCCGIARRKLIVRVRGNEYEQAVSRPQAHSMDFTGRVMRGFVYVDPAGFRSNTQLRVREPTELGLCLIPASEMSISNRSNKGRRL